MRIYIASSWKNQHAVDMMTDHLREAGHQVLSFVEKAVSDEGRSNIKSDFVEWINSAEGQSKFVYDLEGATKSDLVVYIGPSGTDAWAEVGAAYSQGVPVIGLWAKGEPAGLMRLMISWHYDFRTLLKEIKKSNMIEKLGKKYEDL